jgi:hypothetical protein
MEKQLETKIKKTLENVKWQRVPLIRWVFLIKAPTRGDQDSIMER